MQGFADSLHVLAINSTDEKRTWSLLPFKPCCGRIDWLIEQETFPSSRFRLQQSCPVFQGSAESSQRKSFHRKSEQSQREDVWVARIPVASFQATFFSVYSQFSTPVVWEAFHAVLCQSWGFFLLWTDSLIERKQYEAIFVKLKSLSGSIFLTDRHMRNECGPCTPCNCRLPTDLFNFSLRRAGKCEDPRHFNGFAQVEAYEDGAILWKRVEHHVAPHPKHTGCLERSVFVRSATIRHVLQLATAKAKMRGNLCSCRRRHVQTAGFSHGLTICQSWLWKKFCWAN